MLPGAFLVGTISAAEPEMRIGRDGQAIWLEGATEGAVDYVIETQAELATGEAWAPLFEMRGGGRLAARNA